MPLGYIFMFKGFIENKIWTSHKNTFVTNVYKAQGLSKCFPKGPVDFEFFHSPWTQHMSSTSRRSASHV